MEEIDYSELESLLLKGDKSEVVKIITNVPSYKKDIGLLTILMTVYETNSQEFIENLETYKNLYQKFEKDPEAGYDDRVVEAYHQIMGVVAFDNKQIKTLRNLITDYPLTTDKSTVLDRLRLLKKILVYKNVDFVLNIIGWCSVAVYAASMFTAVGNIENLGTIAFVVGGLSLIVSYSYKRILKKLYSEN